MHGCSKHHGGRSRQDPAPARLHHQDLHCDKPDYIEPNIIQLYDYARLRAKFIVEYIYEKRHRHAPSTYQAGVERDAKFFIDFSDNKASTTTSPRGTPPSNGRLHAYYFIDDTSSPRSTSTWSPSTTSSTHRRRRYNNNVHKDGHASSDSITARRHDTDG